MSKVEHYVDDYGNELWKLGGRYHREDGPAIIDASGSRLWLRHGRIHRVDGPAAIYNDGRVRWYINDQWYSFDLYCNILGLDDATILELRLKYG